MKITGTLYHKITMVNPKLDGIKPGPIPIDPNNLPKIPGIPEEYGWVTTMACGEEGNDCGIDADRLEVAWIDDYL